MILAAMKRADINNEIAARIATGLLHRALKFTRPRLHACFCRVAAMLFPEVVQIITGFLGNADYKIKKRERFDIRLRFPASIAVNGGKPQIRRIVKNRNGPRLSLLEKMWQILTAQIAEDVRYKKNIVRSNFFLEINSRSLEETPELSQGIVAPKFRPSRCV